MPDARLLTPKEPCVVMGSSTCYDPVSMPCLNYCPSTWCHWAAHVVFALTNEPGVLPPAHRKSSYLSRSVSFGASPSSSHLTWMAVPAVRVAPGSGLVHLTDALANGASAATAMRGSSRRDIVRCGRSERQSGLLEGAAVRGGGFGGLVSGQGLSAYRGVGSMDVGRAVGGGVVDVEPGRCRGVAPSAGALIYSWTVPGARPNELEQSCPFRCNFSDVMSMHFTYQ
jgi:hypothetical protein